MTERMVRAGGTVIVSFEALANLPDGYLKIIRDDCMKLITDQGRLVDDQIIGPPIAQRINELATEFYMTALVMQEIDA